MGKRRRARRGQEFGDGLTFWESDYYNKLIYRKNIAILLALAINRFRWEGLPETCDSRFLEKCLHRLGIATLSHKPDAPVKIFTTLQAMPQGPYNMYGLPVKWRAVGFDGLTDYEVDQSCGELCYYSQSRESPWPALTAFAHKLAHYERTESVNLTQQMRPFIGIAPEEKRLELINLLKQVQGGEPAIIGDEGLSKLVEAVKVIDTKVPFIGEQLAIAHQNVFSRALVFLGIPNLAFEKGERMIENEVRANNSAANLMLLDCLKARRDFCDSINRKFGLSVKVYFNEDWETLNYNYAHNLEAQAQDGILTGSESEVEPMPAIE